MALHAPDTRPNDTRKTIRNLLIGLLAAVLVATGASTAMAATTPTTIWGQSAPLGAQHVADRESVELGTRFTPSKDGAVTAIRFYKSSTSSGSFTGALWSSSGARLASVRFTSTSKTGWQTAQLDKPVQVTGGASYVASYRTPKGTGFATTRDFVGASPNKDVKIPWRNSGVYTYAKAGTFPTDTWRSSQYWVDVEISVGATTPPTANPTPKPTATTPAPKPTATTPAPAPAPSAPSASGFPTADTTGVPAGWQPKREITGDYTLWEGETLEDVRLTGGVLTVRGSNVTIRRVELVSARIVNEYGGRCFGGLNIEDTSILRGSQDVWQPVIQSGGYTATRVKLDGVSEGFRIAGKDVGCGPVVIQDSWADIAPAQGCDAPGVDWHGDGLQGYWGVEVTLRNSTIHLGRTQYCQGTAAFFYPNQNNTKATIDNVLLSGGGYVFRLETPGSVRNLKIVDDSWEYGPVDVLSCGQVSWGSGNEVVRVKADGSLSSVAPLKCTGW